jgi:L-malate glycosyltransferase
VVLLLSELCKAAGPADAHYLGASEGSEILGRWQAQGGRALALDSGFVSFRNLFAVVRFCRAERINILHAHSSKAHSLGLMAKFFLKDCKLVVHRRVDFVPRKYFVTSWKYLSPKVDTYVAISRAVRDILISIGVPTTKVSIVNSATDARLFNVDRKVERRAELVRAFGLQESTKILASVAYFTEQKDHKTLLHALSLVKKQYPDFVCLLAGGGPLLDETKELAHELGLTAHTRFLGIQPQTEVVNLLLGADIFVMSSCFEALGTSILDAMLAKTCVVATRAGGIPEIVDDGTTGKLCPVQDPKALSESLLAVLRNDADREALAAQGYKKIRATFSVEKMAEGNRAVYAKLLS